MEGKKNIRELSKEQLKLAVVEMGEKPFRASQVYEWLWQKNASTFEEMSSLSKSFRQLLEENYFIDHLTLKDQQVSSDKTIKCAF